MIFGDFHFLRPLWLLAIPVAAFITWWVLRSSASDRDWRGLIAPNLLPALVMKTPEKTGQIQPAWLLGPLLLAACLALAGPSWNRQPTPFAQDQAAVYFLVKVTPSMLAQDIQPSRLERTVQKIDDYLALKPGQKTGLIAYAGSAHLAMPLTDDPEIIRTFAAALTPDAMPLPGENLPAALDLAASRFERAGVPGSLVLFADDADPGQLEAVETWRQSGDLALNVVATAAGPEVVPPPSSPPAPPLNESVMRALADAGGGGFYLLTADSQDMEALAGDVERGIASAPGGNNDQWQDRGYAILPLILLLLLCFFRRGGGVILK